jgi:putative acetyltransferase
MKTLETPRLILRAWSLYDLDDLYDYAKNANVGPNAGWEPHASREASLSILKSFIEKDEVWAIVLKENGKAIGSLGLHKDAKRQADNVRSMGYVLSEAYWGLGLTTEAARRVLDYAFQEMNLDMVSIYHYPFNIRSKRVIEKCGFKCEGTLRCASKIFNGTVYDDVCYSLLKSEYASE